MSLERYERFQDVTALIKKDHRLWPDCYVYALYLNNEVVYVGSTERLYYRIRAHFKRMEHEPEYQFNRILARGYEFKRTALAEEMRLIRAIRPKHNKVGTGRRKPYAHKPSPLRSVPDLFGLLGLAEPINLPLPGDMRRL